jgi:hypothetical protein
MPLPEGPEDRGGHMSQIFVDPYLLCAQGCLLVLVYDFLRGLRADWRAADSDDADQN